MIKEVLAVAVETEDELDGLIQKWNFWKTMRITAWMLKFIENCKAGKRSTRKTGPLTTVETNHATHIWIKRVQSKHEHTDRFQEDKLRLNLQRNMD